MALKTVQKFCFRKGKQMKVNLYYQTSQSFYVPTYIIETIKTLLDKNQRMIAIKLLRGWYNDTHKNTSHNNMLELHVSKLIIDYMIKQVRTQGYISENINMTLESDMKLNNDGPTLGDILGEAIK